MKIKYQITMILINHLKEELRQLSICVDEKEYEKIIDMIGDLEICEKVINNTLDYLNN